MLDIVKKWVNRHNLLKPGSRILAACSGGPDSLALVHILNALKAEYSFDLAVAHVNHMFRLEAAEEAEFVAAFSTSLGLRCYGAAIDVPAFLKANKISSEEGSRLLRYQYLRKVATEWGGAQIATGHHRDDQVETVLINLLRGAGSAGLRGMQPVSRDIIRPLLVVSRREIEVYCTEHKLQPRYDSSNFKTDYRRNRIRLNLLPELENTYNPAIREALWRLASLSGDEHEYISQEAAKLWGLAATDEGDKISIIGSTLAGLHKALQREVIRQAIEKKRGALTGISFGHVEKLLTMALSGTVGTRLMLPGGLIAKKTYTGLDLASSSQAYSDKPAIVRQVEPLTLAVPGITIGMGSKILAEIVASPLCEQGRETAIFDLKELTLPLIMRSRLPGDRFRPLGLGGSKKVKDFFIDTKVPEAVRDYIPIIADQQEIIWVAGCRQSEHARVSGNTQKKLQLTITKQEEF